MQGNAVKTTAGVAGALAAILGTLSATTLLWATGAERTSAQQSAQESGSYQLTAVARTYDRKQLLRSQAASENVRHGRALWLQRCAFCHDGVGQPTYRTMGPWLGAETVRVLGADALRAIIGAGTAQMPGFRYTLQPRQVAQLIEFLKPVPDDQKPTAAQLARQSSGAAAEPGGR